VEVVLDCTADVVVVDKVVVVVGAADEAAVLD